MSLGVCCKSANPGVATSEMANANLWASQLIESTHEGDRPVVVAVVAVRVVETAVDDIADMISVRHSRMATVRPVNMTDFVSTATCSIARAT